MGPTSENAIELYLHCALCIAEMPRGSSPKEWQRVNVGWTMVGIQVWCVRHDCNMLHIDFEGQRHPGNQCRRVAASN